jgi:hypothetical protein
MKFKKSCWPSYMWFQKLGSGGVSFIGRNIQLLHNSEGDYTQGGDNNVTKCIFYQLCSWTFEYTCINILYTSILQQWTITVLFGEHQFVLSLLSSETLLHIVRYVRLLSWRKLRCSGYIAARWYNVHYLLHNNPEEHNPLLLHVAAPSY